MNRYKYHEPVERVFESDYSCNMEYSVPDLRIGDYLHVDFSKVSAGIPNGYQCYIININDEFIDVIMEYQPMFSSGWERRSIPKIEFKTTFWACTLQRRSCDVAKILNTFKQHGKPWVEEHPFLTQETRSDE